MAQEAILIKKEYADVFQNMFQIVDAKCMDDNMDALADAADVILQQHRRAYVLHW